MQKLRSLMGVTAPPPPLYSERMKRKADRDQNARWAAFVADLRSGAAAPANFDEQWAFYRECFDGRSAEAGPPPAWVPVGRIRSKSNLGRLMKKLSIRRYEELYSWTIREREAFWEEAIGALGVRFLKGPDRIMDDARGPEYPVWLPGASLNIVDSCFTADPEAVAVRLGREGKAEISEVTYQRLENLVNRFAAGLKTIGIGPGDGVALYMPMNLECVVAYLGIIRAGGYAISIPDSFSPSEVRKRLTIGRAKLVVTVDSFSRGGKSIPLYERAVRGGAPQAIVVSAGEPALLREDDLLWKQLLADSAEYESIAASPYDVTNLLFSSGTTGEPKAIPWNHLTPIKCAMDGHYHQDIRSGDTVAWPTNIGWMMGPWLIYASLINRASIALYEGLPAGAGFARFIENAGVTMLGTVPSLVKAWQKTDFNSIDWSGIRVFSSTGEPSNSRDYLWLMSLAGYRAPVIEYCGGTEIGGGYLSGTVMQPASPATFTTPTLGMEMILLDQDGRAVGEGEMGEVYIVPPSIGLSQELLNKDHHEIYHEGCPAGPDGELLRRHGDQVARLHGGWFKAQGRSDDTMNLGGIKVGSLELERVMGVHDDVHECAAIGVQVGGEGPERLVVYVVMSDGVGEEVNADATDHDRLRKELAKLIATGLNPLFKIHEVALIDSLPRTASNKLMRRELRADFLGRSGE